MGEGLCKLLINIDLNDTMAAIHDPRSVPVMGISETCSVIASNLVLSEAECKISELSSSNTKGKETDDSLNETPSPKLWN